MKKRSWNEGFLLLLYAVGDWVMLNTRLPGQPGPSFNETMGRPSEDIPLPNAPRVRWWEWPARLFFGPNFRGQGRL